MELVDEGHGMIGSPRTLKSQPLLEDILELVVHDLLSDFKVIIFNHPLGQLAKSQGKITSQGDRIYIHEKLFY
ncbi:hypothetical protein LTR28_001526 [Elasticomyces elasticus]|nr:hypothetical protein LTR28_001526 [Elasticomyces elasticus]